MPSLHLPYRLRRLHSAGLWLRRLEAEPNLAPPRWECRKDHKMTRKAKFLCKQSIFGRHVSFFLPPHGEPDFLWADMDELVHAVSPDSPAGEMLYRLQAVNGDSQKTATVSHDGRIATIAPTPVTQGYCIFVDVMNGHADLNSPNHLQGPANTAFTYALAMAHNQYCPLSGEALAAAVFNQGGRSGKSAGRGERHRPPRARRSPRRGKQPPGLYD